MKWAWLTVVFLLHFAHVIKTLASPIECISQPTCDQCLKSPGCAWCKQKNFLKPGESNEHRCETEEALMKRSCDDIVNPSPVKDVLKDDDLRSSPGHVVQLQPQNIHLKLRVGVPQNFSVQFKRAEGYPIDLYYLMDLSYSMKDDLEKVKSLGQEILYNLKNVTTKVRIGFGSFVDKVAIPYVSTVKAKLSNPCPSRLDTCQPAFSFRNVLALTEDAGEFRTRVSEQKISGNLDSPEGGFDALMQAAVCQDEIGWGNVTRILVYTSDDTFHMAGDGRLAGIYEPNDGKCHLNGDGLYDKGTLYDYPSVGQLSRVLSANNIQLIFAVTERSVPIYKALSELIPQSVVGELKDDSSNVVQLISEAYSNLSSTIFLEHQQAPHGLDISFRSHCANSREHSEWEKMGRCNNVKMRQQVSFTVQLNISRCLPKTETFLIKVQGLREELKVTVETLCDCKCGDSQNMSSHCNNNGKLVCGTCSCDERHLGPNCECLKQQGENTTQAMENSCRQTKSSQLCSGQGRCECGSCRCRHPFRGKFCECDDTSCDRFDGKLCGDQGTCSCGKCQCQQGFTGSACGCSNKTDQCGNGTVLCSNYGNCECNRCKCHAGFIREHCSELSAPCKTYEECVSCHLLDSGKDGGCEKKCNQVKYQQVLGSQHFHCQNDKVTFKVEVVGDEGKILITYAFLPGTIDKTLVAVGTTISAIIVIGFFIIIIYRVLVEMYDRREYQRFMMEREKAEWKDTRNPLYKDATTTVLNPLHFQD